MKLIHGDCLEEMKAIPDASIDMILCDLPYGTTACKWDTVIPFEPLWEQYKRVIKGNGAIVLTASQPFTSFLLLSNLKDYRHQWVWNKNNSAGFATAKIRPMAICEDILVFGKHKVNYYPQMTKGNYERKVGMVLVITMVLLQLYRLMIPITLKLNRNQQCKSSRKSPSYSKTSSSL